MKSGKIIALSKSDAHTFKKFNCNSINLLEGLGVEGDAHLGKTVQHLSRVGKNSSKPNLRQVHLIHSELFAELATRGFNVSGGDMGENITTEGVNLLKLPRNTLLLLGKEVQVMVTGLRNPCTQLDTIKDGLMKAVLDRDEEGKLIRKTGVMGVVVRGGELFVGDRIRFKLPSEPHNKLEPV